MRLWLVVQAQSHCAPLGSMNSRGSWSVLAGLPTNIDHHPRRNHCSGGHSPRLSVVQRFSLPLGCLDLMPQWTERQIIYGCRSRGCCRTTDYPIAKQTLVTTVHNVAPRCHLSIRHPQTQNTRTYIRRLGCLRSQTRSRWRPREDSNLRHPL